MAAITTTTWANELLRIYTRERFFEPMERKDTPVWKMFEEADDVAPRGSGLYFRIILNSAQRVGTPSESGDYPSGGTRTTLQGSVTGVQVASSFEISEKQLNAGKGDGSFSGDSLHDAVVEAAQNLYSHIERLLVTSHGTGRLGQVRTTTDTLTTFVLKQPQVFNVAAGMLIDFYDLDSGGTKQGASQTVTDVSFDNGVVTVTIDAARTLTADWSIYMAGYYGTAPNGLRGVVDDATYQASVFGQARSSYPRLNSPVDDNGGTVRPYKEKIIRKMLHRIEREGGGIPSHILCNSGVISEHLETTIPDRQYTVTGKNVPSYGIGYDEGQLFFQYHNNKIPFRTVRDMPSRELLVLSMSSWRKHTLRKAGWVGGASDMLMPTPSGSNSTYKYTYLASMLADINISCRNLQANGAVRDLRDEENAGDA